ncbi:hypothetical protein BDF19DRAFT_451707, partial [Syncephalis fuscata]
MSLRDNKTLPKPFIIVEIVQRIALFGGNSTVAALSCTCTQIYAAIARNNELWHILYLQKFRIITNIGLIWLWRQYEQAHIASAISDSISAKNSYIWQRLYQQYFCPATNIKLKRQSRQLEPKRNIKFLSNSSQNSELNNCIWMQLYRQRKEMLLNWQNNHITWKSNTLLTEKNTQFKFNTSNLFFSASCPGWVFCINRKTLEAFLVKLSSKKPATMHVLNWKQNNLHSVLSAVFSNNQQEQRETKNIINNNEKENKHNSYLILWLGTLEMTNELQIWNTSNCQLLRTIKQRDFHDCKIVGSSLLYHNPIDVFSQPQYPNGSVTLMTDIFSELPHEPRSIVIPKDIENLQCRIQTTNEKYVNIICYTNNTNPILYEIIQVSITNTSNQSVNDKPKMKVIKLDCLSVPKNMTADLLDFYYVDQNRVLFTRHYIAFEEINMSLGRRNWKLRLTLISSSSGLVWEKDYSNYRISNLIIIPEYNLCVFNCKKSHFLVVISLLDGKLQRHINAEDSYKTFVNFEHITDALLSVTKVLIASFIPNLHSIQQILCTK